MSDESSNPGTSPKATITVELESEEEARVVGGALSVDDDQWVRTVIEGKVIRAVIVSETVDGLKRAGDDWLACLIAAMKGPKGGPLDEAEGDGAEGQG